MATKKTPRSKKTASKKGKKKGMSQSLRIALASGFLLGFVVVCLFALVSLRDRFGGKSAPVVYEEPVQEMQKGQASQEYSYADIIQLVENQLLNGPHSMGWQRLESRGVVQVRKIFGDFPSDAFLAELGGHIEEMAAPARLTVDREHGTIGLLWEDNLRFEMRYKIPEPAAVKQGKIAIIMDDMGGSLHKVRKLMELGLPVTPAILPGTEYAQQASRLLQEANHEFMIHMPMQPRSYPRTNPGKRALLVDQSPDQQRQLVRSYIDELPGAMGGNNHMGSRFTEEVGPMRVVLDELKKRGFFFIDSRTIGNSVAFNEARKMGLKTATRNIFLDNEEDVAYIRKQIRKMAGMAGNNREIVAICHPYKETFEALQQESSWLKEQPVEFVTASKVVHAYSLNQ